MSRPAYRCDDCLGLAFRCELCRARRAAAVRAARATKRRNKLCIMCTADALPGQSRCEAHRVANNEHSNAAHHAARAERYSFDRRIGCVSLKRSRATHTQVGVYHCEQAQLDASEPWVSVCEQHGVMVGHSTLQLARAATDPREWCDDCRASDLT